MNPLAMMKLKPLMEKFRNNHPKVPMFFSAASGAIEVGSVIEISVQTPDGKDICTNMRVNEDDIELVEALKNMIANY